MYHCTSMSWVCHHFQKRRHKKVLGWSVLNVPNRSVSCADLGMAGLHAVTGRQALLQQRRKLLRELLPILFPDLVLEAVQDLGRRKHKTRQSCHLTSCQLQFNLDNVFPPPPLCPPTSLLSRMWIYLFHKLPTHGVIIHSALLHTNSRRGNKENPSFKYYHLHHVCICIGDFSLTAWP